MKNAPITLQAVTRWRTTALALCIFGLTSGCSLVFGTASDTIEPTPTLTRVYAAVPTYTPTVETTIPAPLAPTLAPMHVPTVTAQVTLASAVSVPVLQRAPLTTSVPLSRPVTTPLSTTAAAPALPELTISADVANIRSGPATTFDLVASVLKGERFQVTARTATSDWWQLCCINGQSGWVYGELATVVAGELVAIATVLPPTALPPTVEATPLPVAALPTTTGVENTEQATALSPTVPPATTDPSAGDFNPAAQYQIVHFKVLGLNENNGGIRDSRAQHHIFLTVLDQNGNGLDGVLVENLVGAKEQIVTGSKGPGKAEITMYYEPFKLRVATDATGPVSSQTSNQMGLTFPHLPDIVGKLGGLDYEYAVCPTLEVKCSWPIQAVHFSYEITFQQLR